MRELTKGFADFSSEKRLKEYKEEAVAYHCDTSSIALQTSGHNICYSWMEIIEEPSNKEVFPNVKAEITTILCNI